jgi:hypothetical protein
MSGKRSLSDELDFYEGGPLYRRFDARSEGENISGGKIFIAAGARPFIPAALVLRASNILQMKCPPDWRAASEHDHHRRRLHCR